MTIADSRRSHGCDVAVIGGGVGGLSCAAFLAKQGVDVTLFERSSRVGGLCASFEREGYHFDVGPSVFKACGEGGDARRILQDLDLWKDLAMLRPDPAIRVVGEGYDISFSSGENIFATLAERFPGERDALVRFDEECSGLIEEFEALTATPLDLMSFGQKLSLAPKFLFGLPHFKRNGNVTARDVLDRFFKDVSVRSILCSLCPFPPEISGALFLALVHGACDEVYYPRGGSQAFSDAFAATITSQGGTIAKGSEVSHITVEGGKAVGVELADGTAVTCRFAVSNGDGRRTFLGLVGEEHLPAKCTGALEAPMTGSNLLVSLGVDRDLREEGHEAPFIFYSRCCEQDRAWGPDAEACPVQIRIPTLIDESLAPAGHSVVQILAFLPYEYQDCWGREADGARGERYRKVKEEVADRLIASVEKVVPGLAEHIVYRDVATPLSYERFTMNSKGATGWLPLPGDKLRSQRTPIRNLFQAGQWTYPGAGVPTVMASGRAAADLVLREVG